MGRPRTVAVDFDGVIHRYSRGYADGSIYDDPMPGALDGLRALMQSYAVFVFTARDPLAVSAWLAGHGIPAVTDPTGSVRLWTDRDRILVTDRKLPAIVYLDDRAMRFTTWGQALSKLAPDHKPPIRVLITWSRTWEDRAAVWEALDTVAIERGHTAMTVVHGAASGADEHAAQWCRDHRHLGVTEERHPADWRSHGRSAGPRRNQRMVSLRADVCLAFILDDSPGASGTALLAEASGIKVISDVRRSSD